MFLRFITTYFSIDKKAGHSIDSNLVYVLDALEAYNKRFVKKIEVKGFEVKYLNQYLSNVDMKSLARDGNR